MTLDEWTTTVSEALGLDVEAAAVRDIVLDLARDAAHGVTRPAAPLTTFLLGVAVGRGGGIGDTAEAIRGLVPPP